MVVNEHFERTVRIQKDRKHKVITSGPYRFVRHPSYLPTILGGLSASLAIGSVYSLIPGGVTILAVVVRTYFEDPALRRYAEYTKKN